MPNKRLDWFTIDVLAEEWGYSSERISLYIQSGQLMQHERWTHPESSIDIWIPCLNYRKEDIKKKRDELFSEHYDVEGTYIKLEEVERFEKEHGITVGGDQEEPRNPTPPTREDFPGLPDETPLNGLKKISEHVGLTYDYLKRCWKKDGYPINKSKQKLYAYPSQLNNFRPPKEKK